MMTFISPRLRVPLVYALIGAVFAAAWAVRGGHTWWFSIVFGVAAITRIAGTYIRGGRDTDFGALAGSRADERLKLLRTRSQALAGVAAMTAGILLLAAAIAVRGSWWWPLVLLLAVTGFAYLYGQSIYGVGDEGPAGDDAAAERATR